MVNLDIDIKGKRYHYDIAECFDEMTQEQYCASMLGFTQALSDSTIIAMTGIDAEIYSQLDPYYKYAITELLEWVNNDATKAIKRQLIPEIEIDGVTFIGYQAGFANTTWAEFIHADQFMLRQMYKEAAAVLYRQKKKNWDKESDARIPFTIYGTENRMQWFEHINPQLLSGIVINYLSMRHNFIETRYPKIFGGTSKSDNDFNWLNVHRAILSGEQFAEEEKVNNLNVHTVLNRLDTLIKQQEEYERAKHRR